MFLAGEQVTARKLKCRLISKDEKSMTCSNSSMITSRTMRSLSGTPHLRNDRNSNKRSTYRVSIEDARSSQP